MNIFDPWLRRWSLIADGAPIVTTSRMVWYEGNGAVRVLEIDGPALLLERPRGSQSLVEMSKEGIDDEATRILCATAQRLHAAREREVPSDLIPLNTWFRALTVSTLPLLATSAAAARELLADPQDVVVLHGGIHHGNVLHDTDRGWLAIDPKGLWGERSFDYANIFCNPDLETATAPGRLARQIEIVASEAGLDARRLLKWVLAYAGLSAAWFLEERRDATLPLTIAQIARELSA